MDWDERWRVAARRRQRGAGPDSRTGLSLADPLVQALGLGLLVVVLIPLGVALGSDLLLVAAVLAAGAFLLRCIFIEPRGRVPHGASEPTGALGLSAADRAERIRTESSDRDDLPFGLSLGSVVAASLWAQHGEALSGREARVSGLADEYGWRFKAYDLETSLVLADAGLTSYTPRTCRNVCKGQKNGTPFILTDLTRARYDLGEPPVAPAVELSTATMCLTSFYAPGQLRVVNRDHWLADPLRRASTIETESHAFNRRYVVSGQNNSWTRLVLNPAVLELMMQSGLTSLVIDGGRFAVVVEPWLPTDDLPDLLDTTLRLRRSAGTAAAPEADEPISYFNT